MWPATTELRFMEWRRLRDNLAHQSTPDALGLVNDWWFQAPMVNCSISWHDQESWPGPWQLLVQDGWCDLARCLGITYTLMMSSSNQLHIEIVETDLTNLVLVESGKYILNWCPGQVLNIESRDVSALRRISSTQLQHLLG